jgi:UDP-glucose 4-epimerase
MKKILITGNSGYIGSHLTKLLEDDYMVCGLDIMKPQQQPLVHNYADIRGDVTMNEEYDAVVHLAALVNVGESEIFPTKYYNTNINGTVNVLNGIKTKNFIFASTGAAEGCGSAYGISKRAAEDIVREYCTTKPTPYSIFRFYNVIGSEGFDPTNPDGLMYNLMRAMKTEQFTIFGNDYSESWDGTCVRDYVHVMEICDAIKTAIEKPSNSVECLGHGVGYTVKEIVNMFQKVNDIDIEVKYGPRRKGDLPSSVLEDVSSYMKNLYTMEQLLKVDNK